MRGVGLEVVVKKIFQPFHPCCRHPNSFCQPLSHIIYKAERQTIDLASFLHSISWLWHWQGRSGEECKMGECVCVCGGGSTCKREKVAKERERKGQRWGMRHRVRISTRVSGCDEWLLSADLYGNIYVVQPVRRSLGGTWIVFLPAFSVDNYGFLMNSLSTGFMK